MPNADDIKYAATDVAGKAKELAGHITRNEDLEIGGQTERATATARKNGEDEQNLIA